MQRELQIGAKCSQSQGNTQFSISGFLISGNYVSESEMVVDIMATRKRINETVDILILILEQ